MRTIESALLERIADLEKRLEEMEMLRAENEQQRLEIEQQRLENEQQRLEIEQLKKRVTELEELLKQQADAKAAKKPTFPLNYSSERNEPPEKPQDKKSKKDKKPKKPGRKPKLTKPDQADCTIKIYPWGQGDKPPLSILPQAPCIFHREQFVWRLIDNKAQYVHYQIFAPADATDLPSIPGVRNAKCEYGIEFILMLAHHVYWLGLSMDKARELVRFYTDVDIPKSQVDSLLYQLSHDWEGEYEAIAERIAIASILYIDETGWKVGKKSCYTWVFGTFADVYYRVGVGRNKDILTETIGENFAGTGVSDNYGSYASAFAKHQLCWAHFLRKAIELMLRYPTNKSYKKFYLKLLLIYRRAKRYHEDTTLTTEQREAKSLELQAEVEKLCSRAGEEFVTADQAKRKNLDASLITPIPEVTMIRLQNELVGNLECLFVFVENPAVDGTNNQSERDLRREAQVRKSGNTSKSDSGAKRRATIISVLGSLSRRIVDMTLTKILQVVLDAHALGISLFDIAKPPDPVVSE